MSSTILCHLRACGRRYLTGRHKSGPQPAGSVQGLDAINGLYAAGTGTGGWVNTGYGYPSTCSGHSTYSGYTAGGNAAQYAME